MTSIEMQQRRQDESYRDIELPNKYCILRSSTTWFAVPATAVQEIAIQHSLYRIPGCHPALAGMVRLRSNFIPVFSLTGLADQNSLSSTEPLERLIVMRANFPQGAGQWAIQIAEANALVSLETLGTSEGRADQFDLTGVISTAIYREQMIRILDPQRLYTHVVQILEKDWSTQSAIGQSGCQEAQPALSLEASL